MLVFHEISQRRNMERELQRQAEALLEADRRKDEFLAILSHELRNPLAPLHNGLQILRLQGRDTDLNGLTAMMQRQLDLLTRLVNDLLDVARITRGTVHLEKRPVPLAQVIEHALETARPTIDERGHRLTVRGNAGGLVVHADLARLSQVFSNLLHNAAKFMAPGGQIDLTVTEHSDRAEVRVRDHGRGMDREFLQRIFELFTQEDRSLDRGHGGLGIGLTLAMTIVELHDGEVRAFSAGARARAASCWSACPPCARRRRELAEQST